MRYRPVERSEKRSAASTPEKTRALSKTPGFLLTHRPEHAGPATYAGSPASAPARDAPEARTAVRGSIGRVSRRNIISENERTRRLFFVSARRLGAARDFKGTVVSTLGQSHNLHRSNTRAFRSSFFFYGSNKSTFLSKRGARRPGSRLLKTHSRPGSRELLDDAGFATHAEGLFDSDFE